MHKKSFFTHFEKQGSICGENFCSRIFCYKCWRRALEINVIILETMFNPFLFTFVSFRVEIFPDKFECCIKGTRSKAPIPQKIVAHRGQSCTLGTTGVYRIEPTSIFGMSISDYLERSL